MKFIQSKNETV